MLREPDISTEALTGRRIVLLGYGNQGRPQALNLKDSGLDVAVGLREGSGQCSQATADGLPVFSPEEACQWADVILFMMPDEAIPAAYEAYVLPAVADEKARYIGFAHGLCIASSWVVPDPRLGVFLVAPKAQGRGVRDKFLAGSGVPGLVAVHQDPSGDTEALALAYAAGIGCGRVGVFKTTFREETECDLFSEQVLLCGGLSAMITAAFDTLVEAGYSEEVAAFECLYEVKLLGDLLHERGIDGMRTAISPAARFGDVTRGERVIDGHVRENMRAVLAEIRSGQFAAELKADAEAGSPKVAAALEATQQHPLTQTYRRLLTMIQPK
jgi:ketol-acid reductoisomerase